MLGFKEKRQYQGIINNGLDFLATSPSFSDKRKTQKDIANALEKLGENTPAPDQNIIFLQEVIAGQHDSENVNDLAKNPDLETFTETDLIPDGDDNTVKTAKGTKVSTGFAVAFVVREDNNGNFYHNHTLYREKGAQEIWVELEESSNQRSNPSDIAPQDLSLYRPRPKINTDISPESVDENDVTKSSGFTHFVILWNLRTV